MRLFLVLATVGLALSVAVHASTFVGVNPNRQFPASWLLHPGIFVVFIPALIAASRMAKGASKQEGWQRVKQFAPGWLQGLVGVLFAYALFNFFFNVVYLREGGTPGEIDGELVLHSHGRVLRKLTRDEFERHEAYVVRGFSGHWMLFYGAALLILVARERARRASSDAGDASLREPAPPACGGSAISPS
jgi:hypothetical protein